jgi:hypothetical protein
MVIPDRFIETAAQSEQYDDAGLATKHIFGTALKLVDPSVLMGSFDALFDPVAASEATVA